MNTTRLMALGSVVLIVAVIAGSWFIGISPRLTETSQANTDRAAVEAQNRVQAATLASLKEQFVGMDDLRDELTEMRVAIPADANLPDLISQLNALATRNQVTVDSMLIGDPLPYATVEIESMDPELAAALTSVTAENFFIIPLEVTISGQYGNAMAFLNSVQLGGRLFLVHDLALLDGTMSNDAVVNLRISGQVFVLLESSDVAVVPAEPPPAEPVPTEPDAAG